MLVVLAILSLAIMGLIIYFAVSPGSSRLLKRSALIALGVIAVSLGVCGIILIRGSGKEKADFVLPGLIEAAPNAKSGNIAALIVFLATILFIISLIVLIPLREKRKKGNELKKAGKAPVFRDDYELDIEEALDKEEDSFEIEL